MPYLNYSLLHSRVGPEHALAVFLPCSRGSCGGEQPRLHFVLYLGLPGVVACQALSKGALMPTRVCAVCGNAKDLAGGMVCEKGHFICYVCSGKGKGVVFDYTISRCPVCKTKVS